MGCNLLGLLREPAILPPLAELFRLVNLSSTHTRANFGNSSGASRDTFVFPTDKKTRAVVFSVINELVKSSTATKSR